MKSTPEEPIRAAGILLMTVSDRQQFLLMRHRRRWDLPKGHSESGESFLETALRETMEETGIETEMINVVPDFRFDLKYPVTYKRWGDQVFEKHVRYFLGFIQEKPELRITEHESAEWIDWNPPHRIQTETIDPLLAAVAAYLSSNDS